LTSDAVEEDLPALPLTQPQSIQAAKRSRANLKTDCPAV
jgi:hypothetical protein